MQGVKGEDVHVGGQMSLESRPLWRLDRSLTRDYGAQFRSCPASQRPAHRRARRTWTKFAHDAVYELGFDRVNDEVAGS
jgi:hypothetical protein